MTASGGPFCVVLTMDPAGQPAVRVAVRALVNQLTAGSRPPLGGQARTPVQEPTQTPIQELVETLIRELLTAGHWTPVERTRIDGLRADATLAELIGWMVDGDGPVDPGHRLVRYVASAVQPTVPESYRERIEAGLRLLPGTIVDPDADQRS
ncbi:hypothetical protein [Micromonospora sp. LOL_021]|uniref:hypothetical protein n=1 Tax=Micromonospora sp. LOL_021 TaxID=3345417 RepID=UPI003A8728A5